MTSERRERSGAPPFCCIREVAVAGRGSWHGSDRRAELPANWEQLRRDATDANPEHLCWRCKLPGGEALDHKNGDPFDHRPDNLDWIHDWRSVKAGRSKVNCHSLKTAEDRSRRGLRPREIHPGTGLPSR
jgi:hypothetical protein